MREYQTSTFAITFNGDLVSVDVDWEQLTTYIVTKYKPSRHYVHNDETFFTFDMTQFDLDEICEDMDYFNEIVELSDDEMLNRINSLLSIASTSVRKQVHGSLGKTQRNVPDAGAVEQPDIQEKQNDLPKSGGSTGTNGSLF